MATSSINAPLIVITGPTASGKTGLAIELARQFNGEIICADSRTIYKGMDIGTAKPTPEEQAIVPHFGLDLVEPGEYFSVSDFKVYADQKISEIRDRGHVPFLVGGTGLYIDAVLFDYQLGPPVDNSIRQKLEKLTLDELYKYCSDNNVILPENEKNKRYVIRAIEQNGVNTGRNHTPIENSIVVGIATEKEILHQRIADRTEQLFDNGVVDEAIILGKKYGWESEAMTANVYRLVHLYQENKMTLDEVKEKFTTLDRQLAKRQLTWLRRNPHLKWLRLDEARRYLTQILANITGA